MGIVDKGVLILFGAALAMESERIAAPVIACLIGVIAAAIGEYVTDWRYRCAYIVLFLLGCIFLPELWMFLPVAVYDCSREKWVWLLFLLVPVRWILMAGTPWVWVAFLLIAILLGRRAETIEQLKRENIRLRDSSTEQNLALENRNKSLMEKQDYEIHLATLRERNRIAREIHDNVGHLLSRSILQVGALGTVHREEPLHGQLREINGTLNQAMNSIRESVHDLHDESVDLRQAVSEATRGLSERYQVTVDYDMSQEIPRSVKYCFISVIKEALSNVVKHSNADKIVLTLREQPGFYQLMVEDNGARGDAAQIHLGEDTVGMGLRNMQERVEALNGTFRIHRENGFRIFISIPRHIPEQQAERGMEE